jgi:hypothetical protein
MRSTRRRYQKSILACEDALTLSRDMNTAGLSSAITLCTELLTDYAAHVADFGASAGEHKADHTAGHLTSAVAPTSLATLLTRTNDLTAKYALHNTDAAATTPTYHIADAGAGNALAAETAVTTLAGAITRLNDIKAKYNLHEAGSTAHRTGSLHTTASHDAALGNSVTITTGLEDAKIGDKAMAHVLDDGTGNVTLTAATVGDGKLTLTFSADPQDAVVGYIVASEG